MSLPIGDYSPLEVIRVARRSEKVDILESVTADNPKWN
jgi:hypothetical protein